MNNPQAQQPIVPPSGPNVDDFDSLKPSERFARLAKTVFGVKKQDVDEYLKDHPLERQKPGRKPKTP